MDTIGFGGLDYLVFIGMLGISALIGIYHRFTGGKQTTTEEYLLANRNLSYIPVAFSLMSSFMSAITLLGVSAENYTFGFQFIVINLGYFFFTPIAAYFFLPVFYNLQATSAYKYLDIRFGWKARLITSMCYTLQTLMYMGIVLYAPALVLKSIIGISEAIAIVAVGTVCTFYSTLGGMRAVIWSDVFQSIIMFCALFSIIFVEASNRGGLSEIWKIAQDNGRINLLNFSTDPTERHTWFSLIIGGGFTYLSLYGVNQIQVQRYLTMKDLKTAQKALWLQWPLLTLLSVTTSFTGLSIYSRYHGCDPMRSGRIKNSDELMPLFVKDTMRALPGVCITTLWNGGIFVAGVLSASLTTVSSCLNSLAAISIEDYVKPLYLLKTRTNIPPEQSLYLAKLFSFVYGIVCITAAFATRQLGGLLQASLSIFGAVGGPILGIFTLGMFVPFANETGAVTGTICGLALCLFLAFGGPKPPPTYLPVYVNQCENFNMTNSVFTPQEPRQYFYLFRLSYLWYIVIGITTTIFIGMLVSLITRPFLFEEEIKPSLFVKPVSILVKKKNQERKNKKSILGDLDITSTKL